MLIGLTGGISSGKTTIAKVFSELGATIIDLDSLGHYVLKTDLFVYECLVYSFGAGILNEKMEIDRGKLGRLVFTNPNYLDVLNNIVHPPLIKYANQRIKEELLKNEIVVLDAALLIECKMDKIVDVIVLVIANEEMQVERLMKRGFSEEDALARVRAQMSFKEKMAYADYIIDNTSSISDAVNQAKKIWQNLISQSKSP
jgi:dephospho-CoA kinase